MSEQDQMPDRLGSYRLLDRIGEGGMGVVFLARDQQQRSVALKVLRPAVAGEPTARQRLAREVETMRRVRSPHVAEVIDADLAGDMPYIVTRYVPGRTLDEVVGEDGPLRGAALARLAGGLAEALAAVHAAGVVHRDLKPGNVMLVNSSPVVIDFGIAQGADTTRLTMTGMFMGTPGYLSPEVIEGHPSSEASDVHAWGATVAFAATGRPPFGSGPYETIFFRIVNGQPDLAGAPSALLPLLAAALARDPAQRPSASALGGLVGALDPAGLALSAPSAAGPAALGGGAAVASPTRADLGGAALAPSGPGPSPWDAPGQAVPAAPAPWEPGGRGAVPVGPDGMPGRAGPAAGGNGSSPGGDRGYPGAGHPGGADPPPGTLRFPSAQAADDYSDLLPPAGYPADPWAADGRAPGRPSQDPPPAQADGFGDDAGQASPRGYALLVVAAVALLVGLSMVLPVAGTALAVALILALRAGELSHESVVRRRARGGRGTGAVAALFFPWHLFRSLLAFLGLTVFALVAGVVAVGISLAAAPHEPLPRAIAFAVGAMVAFYGVGPWSGRPRRQLGRVFASLAPTRLSQAAALTGMVMLAVAVLAAAATSASVFWPAPAPPPGPSARFGVSPPGPFHQFGLMARYVIARLRGL